MKIKSPGSFQFVLDELEGLEVRTRAMFGCTAVYVREKITFIFCDREQMKGDRGIWVCIPNKHCAQMRSEYQQLRSVSFFENENAAWQCLPQSCPEFEELALRICGLVRKGDPRIGRVPERKQKRRAK
jgi:hypothetical protein